MSENLVLPFKLAEPEKGVYVVISHMGLVRINSRDLHVAIKSLARTGWGSALAPDEINELLSTIPQSSRHRVVEYLQKIGILREVNNEFGRFSAIRLIHDSDVLGTVFGEDLGYFRTSWLFSIHLSMTGGSSSNCKRQSARSTTRPCWWRT